MIRIFIFLILSHYDIFELDYHLVENCTTSNKQKPLTD